MKSGGLPVFGEHPIDPSSNQTASDITSAEDVTTIAFVAFTSLCILATIVGNVLVVLSIFTYRPLRSVQNYYIVSLACADVAVAIFVMPFNVADYVAGYWQFGAVFCNMWLTFDILMCTASILNLCAIAGDRFFAIHDPINYAQKRTLRRVLSVIAIVWTASAIISIPPLFGWNNSSSNSSSLYDEINRSCKLTDEPGFVLYSASGSFYIPLAIMAFLYAKIYRATRERLRKRVSANLQSKSERMRRDTGDSPNPQTPQSPNHNGSIKVGEVYHNPLGKAIQGVKKNAEGLGELLEGGKGVEGGSDGEGHLKGQTEAGERGACTSETDPKKSLKRDDGTATRDNTLRPPCDNICKHAKNSDDIAKKSGEVKHSSADGKRDNNCSSGKSDRNGNGTFRDGNGTLNDCNETVGDGNGTVGNGSNKTGQEIRNKDDKRCGNDAVDLPSNAQRRSKKTRCKTKNSLKISSSLPRRSPRPSLAVSILNRTNRSQSENWTKTETHLQPVSLKPHRWNSKHGSPDSDTHGSQLSQILGNRQKISLSKERRAARTMAIVMGAFVLCWLPFFLMYVIFPFCESCRKNTDPRVKNFIVWLGYINSMLNPVIYTIFNIDFRRAFKSLLQGNCRIVT